MLQYPAVMQSPFVGFATVTNAVKGECRCKIVSHGDVIFVLTITMIHLMTEVEVRPYVCCDHMIFCSGTVFLRDGIASPACGI